MNNNSNVLFVCELFNFILSLYISANQVVMLYLPFYCISVGMSTTDGAILMSIIGIGLTIGELIIGIFLDIFHIKSDHLMTFSLICMGLTTLAIPLLYDLYAIGALITIWSIAVGEFSLITFLFFIFLKQFHVKETNLFCRFIGLIGET